MDNSQLQASIDSLEAGLLRKAIRKQQPKVRSIPIPIYQINARHCANCHLYLDQKLYQCLPLLQN